MVREIPNAVLDLVEGAGHVLPEEVAERVNQRLAEFVAGAGDDRADRVAAGVTAG
jgi:pimeloyl-ACP methyl ester carboxylesterase